MLVCGGLGEWVMEGNEHSNSHALPPHPSLPPPQVPHRPQYSRYVHRHPFETAREWCWCWGGPSSCAATLPCRSTCMPVPHCIPACLPAEAQPFWHSYRRAGYVSGQVYNLCEDWGTEYARMQTPHDHELVAPFCLEAYHPVPTDGEPYQVGSRALPHQRR